MCWTLFTGHMLSLFYKNGLCPSGLPCCSSLFTFQWGFCMRLYSFSICDSPLVFSCTFYRLFLCYLSLNEEFLSWLFQFAAATEMESGILVSLLLVEERSLISCDENKLCEWSWLTVLVLDLSGSWKKSNPLTLYCSFIGFLGTDIWLSFLIFLQDFILQKVFSWLPFRILSIQETRCQTYCHRSILSRSLDWHKREFQFWCSSVYQE